MKSPLRGDYYNPAPEKHIDTVGMIQQAANAISSAGLTIDAKDKQKKTEETFQENFGHLDPDSKEYKDAYVKAFGVIKPKEE